MRKRDYLFKRNGSQYWRVRFQMGGRSIEQSLKTTERREAELAALPMIAEHKAKLLARRPRLDASWKPQYEPGLHVGPDGRRIFATERELHHLDAEGRATLTTQNGGLSHALVGGPLNLRSLVEAVLEADFGEGRGERPTAVVKNADDAILENVSETRQHHRLL